MLSDCLGLLRSYVLWAKCHRSEAAACQESRHLGEEVQLGIYFGQHFVKEVEETLSLDEVCSENYKNTELPKPTLK